MVCLHNEIPYSKRGEILREDHILHDSIYMKCSDQGHSEGQRVHQWVADARGRRHGGKRRSYSEWIRKNVLKLIVMIPIQA